ncbi:MAG: type IX secretion system protein PorQ [Bacteroidota bacterium]
MKFLLPFLVFITSFSWAQTGGENAFPLLNLGFSARAVGLGNDFISAKDQDVSLGVLNPSLLNEKMHTGAGFNHAILSGGINYGMAAYAHKLLGGVFAAHVRYLDYGKMLRTTIDGQVIGSFQPFEAVIGVGYGRQLNKSISVGANFNVITSSLENYGAFGLSLDLAGTYTNAKENLLVTALFKNAGVQVKKYTDTDRVPLPAELQMAISYKLEHAPFRFSLLAHHLNKWDITYNDPNLKPTKDPLTGDSIPVPTAGFGEKLFRHFTPQVEIIIADVVHLRTAFDYHRRQEMKLESRPGVAGFSFGLGLFFKRFSIDYGFSVYSRAGFNNMISLSTHLSKWKK